MPDLILNIINDGHNGTSIEAQGERYADKYVFSADAGNADVVHRIDGLRGVGVNEGYGVVGWGGEGGAGVSGRGGQALQRGQVRVAGTGVIGHGGLLSRESSDRPGAGVIGVSTDGQEPSPESRMGAGVVGVGATPTPQRAQLGGTGVVGIGGVPRETGTVGAGVVGISSAIQFPPSNLTAGVGVYGSSADGPGVVGVAAGPVAVEDRGAPGVVGGSSSGPGGEFSSAATGQVRLVPAKETRLPIIGRRGDLWVHRRRGRASKLRQTGVSLYICVQDQPTVQWQLVMLDPVRIKGGTVVP